MYLFFLIDKLKKIFVLIYDKDYKLEHLGVYKVIFLLFYIYIMKN